MSTDAVTVAETTPPARRKWRPWLVAMAAMALATFFFAPRFVVWRGFGINAGVLARNIEIFRSPRFVHQIEEPFDIIKVPSDQVIQWRLLFPLLGHYLHLPVTVMWILPWIGCLLALVLAARFLWAQTRDPQLVWLGTLLMATCSWYFVATGWAFYFDGWLIAALLLATFARARWQLFVVAFLTPWIDERFILALPLCLAVRWTVLSRGEDYRWRDWWKDIIWLGPAGTGPYLLIRLWAYGANVWQPDYLVNSIGFTSPFTVDLEGAWFGLRAAWIPVLLWPLLVWRRGGKHASALAGAALAVLLGSVVFHVGMAGDVSRSASVAVPALLAGVMAWREWPARWAGCGLIAVCIANFLLPARHVVTSDPVSRIPIYYLHTSLAELRQPPDQFNPVALNMMGQQTLIAAQDAVKRRDVKAQEEYVKKAYDFFTAAIGLAPDLTDALNNRGILRYNFNDKAGALDDFNQAIIRAPKNPAAWLNRAQVRLDAKDFPGTKSDLEKTIEVAPSDWPNLDQAKAILKELQAAGH